MFVSGTYYKTHYTTNFIFEFYKNDFYIMANVNFWKKKFASYSNKFYDMFYSSIPFLVFGK